MICEICVDSVAGVRAAKASGAQRVELCADLLEGGITPCRGMIRQARTIDGVGLHVIIRPRGGDFLFDEPLSNLDAKLRVQMRAEIKELHQRLKTTTIYVTHDQIEAMTMADRIVVLRDGVIEQIGAPLDLYDRPANLFVAGFIGSPSMNLLNGTIRLNGSPTFVIDGGVSLPLASAPADSDGRRAIYGIRPEHLMLSGTEGMPVEVSVLEPTGQETQVFAKVGEQKIVAVFRQRLNAKPGETLPMMPEVGLAHLFDAETGARIG